MEFSESLYRLRLEKGTYQKQLAIHLHVSIGTMSNYENGIHSPDLKTTVIELSPKQRQELINYISMLKQSDELESKQKN